MEARSQQEHFTEEVKLVTKLFFFFKDKFSLCSPGWPQSCHLPVSTSNGWDYRHVALCPTKLNLEKWVEVCEVDRQRKHILGRKIIWIGLDWSKADSLFSKYTEIMGVDHLSNWFLKTSSHTLKEHKMLYSPDKTGEEGWQDKNSITRFLTQLQHLLYTIALTMKLLLCRYPDAGLKGLWRKRHSREQAVPTLAQFLLPTATANVCYCLCTHMYTSGTSRKCLHYFIHL